jgi:hypothetical protein
LFRPQKLLEKKLVLYSVIILAIAGIFAVPVILSTAYAHTIDSVGDYRLEIGWINEPVVSGETNGIELLVSPFDPNLPPEEQEFKDGISGLEKTLKIQLVYKEQKITFPLKADSKISGKYYTFVSPTSGGYYQANILGKIEDTTVSLSMHPPRVENKTYLEFPPLEDPIKTEHTSFRAEINEIKEMLDRIKSTSQIASLSYVAISLGFAGIVIALISISKKR